MTISDLRAYNLVLEVQANGGSCGWEWLASRLGVIVPKDIKGKTVGEVTELLKAANQERLFRVWFNAEILPFIQYRDTAAKREAWNNAIDSGIKGGDLPESAGDWCY